MDGADAFWVGIVSFVAAGQSHIYIADEAFEFLWTMVA